MCKTYQTKFLSIMRTCERAEIFFMFYIVQFMSNICTIYLYILSHLYRYQAKFEINKHYKRCGPYIYYKNHSEFKNEKHIKLTIADMQFHIADM